MRGTGRLVEYTVRRLFPEREPYRKQTSVRKSTSEAHARGSGNPRAGAQLRPAKATAAMVIPSDRPESLTEWFELYIRIAGGVERSNTFKAKESDLKSFLDYLLRAVVQDHPDLWITSVTKRFLKQLRHERKSPSTINRVLATLKHSARWIEAQRPFLAGNPTDRVKNLAVGEPEWKGLRDIDVMRLQSAAEELCRLSMRKDQQPLRAYAILILLLHTGLRLSELLSLDLGQYGRKQFTGIIRNGKEVSHVLVPRVAREILDRYINQVRGRKPGPLFSTRTGHPLSRQKVHDAMQAIACHANSTLPADDHIHLSARLLRQTFLQRLAEKHGVQHALEVSGHTSDKYIRRYVQLPRSR